MKAETVPIKGKKQHRFVRALSVRLLSFILVTAALFGAVRIFLFDYVYPVDEEDATPIEVVIPQGASASTIASILYHVRGEDEKGLIASKTSFKIYVDFIGKANSLQAGTYLFSRNMSIAEIVHILCTGNQSANG